MDALEPTSSTGLLERLRRGLAVAGIAGLGAGLVGGGLARVAMRIFAVEIGAHGAFTIGGTLGILVFGLLIGIVAANVYIAIRAVVPGPWPVPAIVLGAAAAALVIATLGGPGNEGQERPELARALFAGVGLVGSFATAWIVGAVRARFAAAGWQTAGAPAVGLLLSVATLLILGFALASGIAQAM